MYRSSQIHGTVVALVASITIVGVHPAKAVPDDRLVLAAPAQRIGQSSDPAASKTLTLSGFFQNTDCSIYYRQPELMTFVADLIRKVKRGEYNNDSTLRERVYSELTSHEGFGDTVKVQSVSKLSLTMLDDDVIDQCFPALSKITENANPSPSELAQSAWNREYKERLAIENTPTGQLLGAYENYLTVRLCAESRRGFAALYVTEEQIAAVRKMIAEIERGLLASDRKIDKDQLWTRAQHRVPIVMLGVAIPEVGRPDIEAGRFTAEGAEYCRDAIVDIRELYGKMFPDQTVVKKDF